MFKITDTTDAWFAGEMPRFVLERAIFGSVDSVVRRIRPSCTMLSDASLCVYTKNMCLPNGLLLSLMLSVKV